MDPDSTLKLIADELRAGRRLDNPGVYDHARNLINWLDAGGFPLEWSREPGAAEYVRTVQRQDREFADRARRGEIGRKMPFTPQR